ncbi:hypothetical protein ACNFR7_02420 [Streptomyces sp. RM1]|uniref:hypothetical protein n=1 Tax=Streptomyces misionensis TaxID=67331 RepID=UPI00396BE742
MLHTTQAVRLRADRGARARMLTVLPKNADFYAQGWGVMVEDAWWAYGEGGTGVAGQVLYETVRTAMLACCPR